MGDSSEEWEPLFGTYGWLWISIAAVAVFVAYKLIQRRIDNAAEKRRHQEKWGQRPDESHEQWQVRVEIQREEDRKRQEEWDARARAREQSARRRLSRDLSRGHRDFDAPGGWGATGPDNG